jgi:hypothetical protein
MATSRRPSTPTGTGPFDGHAAHDAGLVAIVINGPVLSGSVVVGSLLRALATFSVIGARFIGTTPAVHGIDRSASLDAARAARH